MTRAHTHGDQVSVVSLRTIPRGSVHFSVDERAQLCTQPRPCISAMSFRGQDLPEGVREREIWGGKEPSCWGLGWRVNHPGTELKFGTKEGLTYGHHGVSLPAPSCPLPGFASTNGSRGS